jgi:NADH-quinone oxidoreductase subunit M
MVQPDLKRLVAYSSVSHLGFVMLGLFALNVQGLEGAIYQMLNHGLSTGGLFLLVGMMYLRRHTREIAEFGGLWKRVPVYAAVFMVVMLSSAGLPGLNGFIGEFLILLGAFLHTWQAVVFAVSGLILGALYLFYAYERVMFGPITKTVNETIADLNGREIATMVPLLILMFVMGLYPRPLLRRIQPSVMAMLARTNQPIVRIHVQPSLAATSTGEKIGLR